MNSEELFFGFKTKMKKTKEELCIKIFRITFRNLK